MASVVAVAVVLAGLAHIFFECGASLASWWKKFTSGSSRAAKTPQAARWSITNYINYARSLIGVGEIFEPMRKALATLERHAERVVRRWTSTYTNARMEGLNSLFQAARARARGYRTNRNFITIIYMIASPAGVVLNNG